MSSLGPGFSVVLTTNDRPQLIKWFVEYYLGLGASVIYVYYDGTADRRVFDLGSRVLVETCDDTFWEKLGQERSDWVEGRQHYIYNYAKGICETEWLLVVDTDEFVFGDVDLSEFLGSVPRDVDGIRMPSAEALFGPGEDIDVPFGGTWFRPPVPDRRWRAVKYAYDRRTRENMHRGLLGHAAGKHFVRVSADGIWIRNHNSMRNGRGIGVAADDLLPSGKRIWLGHFDAISYRNWFEKWQRRMTGEVAFYDLKRSARNRQLIEFSAACELGQEALRSLFRRSYCINNVQKLALMAAGCVFSRDVFGLAGHSPKSAHELREGATR